MNNLELIKSENFGTVQCDFYQNEHSDILMTRKQIGIALGYKNPDDALYRIHERHKDRLDKFSVLDRLSSTDGKAYETYLYTTKGVMEICRWSQQPTADAFMDWVWEIIDGLRTGKFTLKNNLVEEYMNMSEEDKAILYFKQLKEKKDLEQQKALMTPKAEAFDVFMSAENAQTMAEIAKALGTGRNKLFEILRTKKILMCSNIPYQRYIDDGYFIVKEKPITMGESTINKPQTFVTAKGVNYISKILNQVS
jgi:phage antirepressor YoqD-like protein